MDETTPQAQAGEGEAMSETKHESQAGGQDRPVAWFEGPSLAVGGGLLPSETLMDLINKRDAGMWAVLENAARNNPIKLADVLQALADDPIAADVRGVYQAAGDLALDIAQHAHGLSNSTDGSPWEPIMLDPDDYPAGPRWEAADRIVETLGFLIKFGEGEPMVIGGPYADLARGILDARERFKAADWASLEEGEKRIERLRIKSQLAEAALSGLRAEGILRGPCPRCGRLEWYTPYRAPKTRGKIPLTHTYCPACVDEIQKEKEQVRSRRSYEQKRDREQVKE